MIYGYVWGSFRPSLAEFSDGQQIFALNPLCKLVRMQCEMETLTNLCVDVPLSLCHTNSYVWDPDLSGFLQGAGGIGGLLAAYRSDPEPGEVVGKPVLKKVGSCRLRCVTEDRYDHVKQRMGLGSHWYHLSMYNCQTWAAEVLAP